MGDGLKLAHFFDNSGGLNNADAPFKVKDGQSIFAYNYDYSTTGGFEKRMGHGLLSPSLDTLARSLGYHLYTSSSDTKTLLRAAGAGIETINRTTGTTTRLSNDTATPSNSFFTSNQPVVFSQFNTQTTSVAWFAGGGMASGFIRGYNGIKITQNGSATPTGSLTDSTVSGTQNLPTGTYMYAIALVKAATGAVSNAALDHSVSVTNGSGNVVRISFSSLTGLDTTKYSFIRIYRSAISGVTGFTTGDLIGTVASTATHFDDDGSVAGNAVNIPRAGNLVLDNSVLPAGTYKTLTTWKRRLVTAQNSTVYFSDLDKPESWPTSNSITIPSGGSITALGIISFSTPTTTANDEFLVVFKERECWVITGTSLSDWALKFIDYVGCVNQPLLTSANGFLAWIDYRGIYLWDGSYKPIYVSRPIEADFKTTGDMDLTKLSLGWGTFFRKQNEIIWVVSSISLGEQKLTIKLDVRLTYPQIEGALAGRVMEGVFAKDSLPFPLYAGVATLPNSDETLYAGDNIGNTYTMFTSANDITNEATYWDQGMWDQDLWDYRSRVSIPIAFKYRTKIFDLGLISITKRINKIIVWCKDSSTSNLTLNYWVNYRLDSAHMATQQHRIADFTTNAYYDQAFWDQAQWDLAGDNYVPMTFNLTNGSIGVDGDGITLEFAQDTLNTGVIIAGFTIVYSELGMRK